MKVETDINFEVNMTCEDQAKCRAYREGSCKGTLTYWEEHGEYKPDRENLRPCVFGANLNHLKKQRDFVRDNAGAGL